MLTVTMQDELPARAPFANSISCVPETAVKVPPQLLTGAGAVPPASVRPAGSESLSPIPVKATFPVFRIVIVSVEAEPTTIEFGEKNLLTLAPGKFVNEALAGSTFITPFAVVT